MKVYKSQKAQEQIWETYEQLLAAWDTPVEQVDVPTSYGITHVNVCGSTNSIPLVMFHGVGDDSALMWIYNAQFLAKNFRLYAVDTIGGPGKSIPNENYNKDFSDEIWIDQILDYFHLEQVNIAGVSHGGYLAQYYALKRPDRVRKILCMAATVPVSTGGGPMKTMMKIFLPEALFPTQKNIAKLLTKMSGQNSAAFTENPLIMAHFTAVMKGFNNGAMMNHKTPGFLDKEIAQIRDKSKYLIGEADPFSLLGGREIQERYYMNTVFFPNTGHGINHENAPAINDMITNYFLD